MADEQDIRAEIDAAFGHVPAARADEILQPSFARNDEAQEMAATFGGRHWTDLSLDDLFHHRAFVIGLNGLGYRAYLAAYLAACLTNDLRRTPDIQEYMLFGLRPLTGTDSDIASTKERLSLLDDAQRRAVGSVLRYLEERWDMDPGDLVGDWK
jgi:hypothetical protein